MWAMLVCQLISPLATHRHLHALDGVQHQQAQLPVEHVEVQHLRKVGAGLESVRGVVGFEWQPVGPKPVVVEVLQVELGGGRVLDDHATLLKQRHLLGVGGGRLGEGALHRALPNPQWVADFGRTKK